MGIAGRATPESYADVRLGAVLPEVISNLAGFREHVGLMFSAFFMNYDLKPKIGIVFVAMKRNVADLHAVFTSAIDWERFTS